jgi:hypothetical protein
MPSERLGFSLARRSRALHEKGSSRQRGVLSGKQLSGAVRVTWALTKSSLVGRGRRSFLIVNQAESIPLALI